MPPSIFSSLVVRVPNVGSIVRKSWLVVLPCWFLAGVLHAQELRGSIKKWDAASKQLTVESGGKVRDVALPASARVVDARGSEIVEPLLSKVLLQSGNYVKIVADEVDKATQAKVVHLRNYFIDRPDEFYLDSEKAGPDFLIQGEYEGEFAGRGKLGAQVIAIEDGVFSVLFFSGGLPGAGMELKAIAVKAPATTAAGKTTFMGPWNGQIADEKLTGTTDAGMAFALTRVIRKSPTLGSPPPKNALVLFDGTGTEQFVKSKMSDDRLLKVAATTKQKFKDFQLHIEFQIPYRGPSGGNSGVYLQNCYEVQVFDSFGGERAPNGCGGIYVFRAPDVNMSLPPLSWQTFDVDFAAAKFDAAGNMEKRPVATIRHNGVVIHDNVTLPEKSQGRPTSEGGPLFLQHHGSPVRYRNIWLVEK